MTNKPFSEKTESETESFVQFLNHELRQKGWSDYKLAKQAGISPSVISRARTGTLPKLDACGKIAQALELPIEIVLRAAGLLPQLDKPTRELLWINLVYPGLSDDDRLDIRALIESKIRRRKEKSSKYQSSRPK